MTRLNEQEAKKIVFNAQVASYPSNDVPLLLKPLYEYVESVEAENAMLKKVLELVISNHTIDSETADIKLQRYINFVKEEVKNERYNNYKNSNSEQNSYR